MTRRFRSKVDAWVIILLAAGMAGQLLAMAVVLQTGSPGRWRVVTVILLALGMVLFASLPLRTHYTVADGRLLVASGPFTWCIKLSDIRRVEPSRAAWSSPALSLDRLKINYGRGKWLLVSPADKQDFLRAIGQPGE